VWTGGLAALTLVLPAALTPYEGEQRRLALLAAMRRFSPLAAGAAAVTVTTGIYNALNWLYAPADITSTYGTALVYKLLLVAGLLAVGAVHHIAANQERFARWQKIAARLGGWRVTLPLETLAALAVLVAAGLVSATPPPTPAFVEGELPAPESVRRTDGITAQMTLSPGGLGVNTYDVRLLDGVPADSEPTVYVQMVRPDEDRRGVWHTAEPVERGLYVAAGDEFDAEGAWLALVDVVRPGGDFTRLVYEWDISDDASVIDAIPPRIQHWLALGAVVLALAWVIAPLYRAFMRLLNLNALTGTVILLAIFGTGAITWGSYVYIVAVQGETARVLNPPPEIVNPVLPDMDSLRRGADLYAAACTWEDDDGRVFDALVERLPRTRDDELFAFVADGWRALAACDGALTNTERWHIVNYVRTFERR
jgi:hypothetical protein